MNMRYLILKTLWFVLALALMTPFSGPLDLYVSRLFFTNGHFASGPFYDFVYHYALYPGWIIIAISLLTLVASPFYRGLKNWRKPAAYLILTLALGSGLFVHAIFKDHWGRPRPRQVVEFGGSQPFRAYYQPHFTNQPEPSKSFPCGHCSMGFYFFAIALLGMHEGKRSIYIFGMLAASFLGGVLGFVRIAQGGHFLSDVIVSGLIMWLMSLCLYPVLMKGSKRA
jgi:lipid A 4'-phosphatase